jgi:hypothetical protein
MNANTQPFWNDAKRTTAQNMEFLTYRVLDAKFVSSCFN